MNEYEREKPLLLKVMELIESWKDTEGVKKSEIREQYIKRYGPISGPRLGGSIDILVEFALLSENERTKLFNISPLGLQFLDRARYEKKSIVDLCHALLSKGLNSQPTS